MRLTLATTLLIGALLLFFVSRREKATVPKWVPMLAIAIGALGMSTAAASQPGVAWSIASICFSLVAIVLILIVIRDILRR